MYCSLKITNHFLNFILWIPMGDHILSTSVKAFSPVNCGLHVLGSMEKTLSRSIRQTEKPSKLIRTGRIKFSLCPSPSFKGLLFSDPHIGAHFFSTSLFDFRMEEAYVDWKNIFKFRNPRQYFKGFTLPYFTISS